jgi:hypothetical protein
MTTFEQYAKAEQEYFDFLESIANIKADVEAAKENPPADLNKRDYAVYNFNKGSDASGDSVSEEVLDSTLESWVSKKY